MKKFVALCTSALLLGAQPASAATYTPAGSYLFTGTVDVYKGIALTCKLEITLVVPSTPSSTATATPVFKAGNLLCPTVTFSSTPYAVTYNASTSQLTLSGVVVNTITPGGCSGSISGTWDNSAKTLDIDAFLPGGGGSADCTVSGLLTAPSTLSIT
jgi:hypothetical protein